MENKSGHFYYIEQLKQGNTVTFSGKGNSMVPKIKSGQKCKYAPITDYDTLKKGDMVFCHVGKYYFTHLITGIRGSGEKKMFQISNNHGHVNGWVSSKYIYGLVIEVLD